MFMLNMTDIQHVLYGTIGQDFESFLAPEELHAMSLVSSTTRTGFHAERFRKILDYILGLNLQIKPIKYSKPSKFKYNIGLTFQVYKPRRLAVYVNYPLRKMVKELNVLWPDDQSYAMKEIYDVAEYLWNTLKISTIDISLMRAELNTPHYNQLVYNTLTDIITLRDRVKSLTRDKVIQAGYDVSLYDDIVRTADDLNVAIYMLFTERLNPKVVDFILSNKIIVSDNTASDLTYNAYVLDPEVRRVVLSYDTDNEAQGFIDDIYSQYGQTPKDKGGYACIALKKINVFDELTYRAVKLQDYDLYVAYLKEYWNQVPEALIEQGFQNGHIDTITLSKYFKGFKK